MVISRELLPIQRFIGLRILSNHADTIAGLRVDQIEMDVPALVLRAVERHRAGDERQS
jgi:hypothetical protein